MDVSVGMRVLVIDEAPTNSRPTRIATIRKVNKKQGTVSTDDSLFHVGSGRRVGGGVWPSRMVPITSEIEIRLAEREVLVQAVIEAQKNLDIAKKALKDFKIC